MELCAILLVFLLLSPPHPHLFLLLLLLLLCLLLCLLFLLLLLFLFLLLLLPHLLLLSLLMYLKSLQFITVVIPFIPAPQTPIFYQILHPPIHYHPSIHTLQCLHSFLNTSVYSLYLFTYTLFITHLLIHMITYGPMLSHNSRYQVPHLPIYHPHRPTYPHTYPGIPQTLGKHTVLIHIPTLVYHAKCCCICHAFSSSALHSLSTY